MKIFQVVQRCASHELYRFNLLPVAKTLSTYSKFGSGNNDNQNTNSSESSDDFEKRMFDGSFCDNSSSFYRKLDMVEKVHAGSGMYSNLHGLQPDEDDESFSTLSDGLDGKLKKAATYFEVNEDEVEEENYSFRPDSNLTRGMTYTPEDLNLRKPGVWKATKQFEFEVTTAEVLSKADFRNVRFLANFLTEAGIIIKRSKTGISAKAQRKIAREIKTARAFGLLPFTTMGTKSFVFGRTMEDLDEDFIAQRYDDPMETKAENSVVG